VGNFANHEMWIAIVLLALGGMVWPIWVYVLCRRVLALTTQSNLPVSIKVRWLSSVQIESHHPPVEGQADAQADPKKRKVRDKERNTPR
jgi:hypothetical protein